MEWAGHGNERPVMLGVHTQQQVPFLPRFVSLLRLRGRRAALMKRNFYHRALEAVFFWLTIPHAATSPPGVPVEISHSSET